MDKIFTLKNFIEKEAEEDNITKEEKLDSNQNKDTQYSTQINNEEDSYGISSDNDTEKILSKKKSKDFASHRLLLQKEIIEDEKIIKNQLKRKRMPKFEKKDNKRRTAEHIKNNINKIENSLGIINGKLNIGFSENKENKNVNNENDGDKTPEKKFKDEDDEEVEKLKMANERRKIENINKNINTDFIKRIKDNENFLKNNNIIIDDGSEMSNKKKFKRNNSEIGINRKNILSHPKLKLYNLKGAFLNKKK